MTDFKKSRASLAVAVLSAAGFLICSYLTAVYYLTDGAAAYCGAGWDCNAVLTSRYSKMFGIPASLFGAVGYAVLIVAAALGGLSGRRALIIGVGSAGLGISAYLSWAEFFVIKQVCPFCVASAVIMTAVWAISVFRVPFSHIAAGIVIAFAAGITGYSSAALGGGSAAGNSGYVRADFQKGLAAHLAETGAVMYGSFKCPACQTQKNYFGRYGKKLNYVECHPEGAGARPELCSEKKIAAYPTWEIAGEFHKGAMTLKKLSRLSSYKPAAKEGQ